MIGQGELRAPHASREHKRKLYVPPPGTSLYSEHYEQPSVLVYDGDMDNISSLRPRPVYWIFNNIVSKLISYKNKYDAMMYAMSDDIQCILSPTALKLYECKIILIIYLWCSLF